MESNIKSSTGSKHIVIALLGALVAYFLINGLVDSRFSEIEQNTRSAIAEQEKIMVLVAETMARSGADEVTESIIKDCTLTERNEFDNLLANLNNGLSSTQLTQLERLFGRCGDFYAKRKAVMSARFTREIEVFALYVSQLAVIGADDAAQEYRVAKWEELAEAEQKLSDLFSELVLVQDEIIASLLSGNSADSEETQTILQRAGEIQQNLLVTNQQAAAVRSELVPL
jgi:spore maturation protein SpmB